MSHGEHNFSLHAPSPFLNSPFKHLPAVGVLHQNPVCLCVESSLDEQMLSSCLCRLCAFDVKCVTQHVIVSLWNMTDRLDLCCRGRCSQISGMGGEFARLNGYLLFTDRDEPSQI